MLGTYGALGAGPPSHTHRQTHTQTDTLTHINAVDTQPNVKYIVTVLSERLTVKVGFCGHGYGHIQMDTHTQTDTHINAVHIQHNDKCIVRAMTESLTIKAGFCERDCDVNMVSLRASSTNAGKVMHAGTGQQ